MAVDFFLCFTVEIYLNYLLVEETIEAREKLLFCKMLQQDRH